MAKLTNSVGQKYRNMGLAEDEAPEHVETEGEQLVKELVKKQTSTQTSLAEQLSLQQNFTPSTELIPLAKYPCGECSLENFSARAKHIDFVEDLKRRGMSNGEIQLALDLHRGESYLREKHKISEASAFDTRLTEVKTKLATAASDGSKNNDPAREIRIGRHERELMESVKPQSVNTKLLQFAQKCHTSQPSEVYPPDHPMNQLPELEQKLFGHLKTQPRKRKRKLKSDKHDVNALKKINHETTTLDKPGIKNKDEIAQNACRVGSQWDKRESPACSRVPVPPPPAGRLYSCTPQIWYTVKDNKPVFLGHKLPPKEAPRKEPKPLPGAAFVAPTVTPLLIPLDQIQAERLTNTQILLLPRFTNYQEGVVSKTLFVKNLSGCVKETDLVRVFGHFEDPNRSMPRLVYRLMGGKMRGQAFVTFPDTELSEKALNTVNGFKLKGKPIIIQYGRQEPT